MGTVYLRGDKLWIGFQDVDGTRRYKSSGFKLGEEKKAEKVLEKIEAKIAAAKALGATEAGPPTLRRYAERWLKHRPADGIATAADETSRMRTHVYPALGDMPLAELRPRHIRDFVRKLKQTKARRRKGMLAPRSIRNIYGTLHRMLHDAQVDELIDANPCVLKKTELPGKTDSDPTWRAGAVFTREEAERLISDDGIPEDRRVVYGILLLAGVRFGEASALRWRHYDPSQEPLGRLLVEGAYSVKKRKETSTKTENPRAVPVHPTLARVLAEWKLSGWERMVGRPPRADDLIVPSRLGVNRSVNQALKRLHTDLARMGLRARRTHDTRRSFISLCLADGARKDILRWVTHGPTGDIMDLYTTLPWSALCEAVSCLKLTQREGKIIALPVLRAATGPVESTPEFTTLVTTVPDPECERPEINLISGRF